MASPNPDRSPASWSTDHVRAAARPWIGAALVLVLAAVASGGCAKVPKNRYGVDRLAFEGVEKVDPRTLAACLATRERDHFAITIGRSWSPTCGDPPFDTSRARLEMWRWPWTDWPLYDRALFDRDLDRIERWYKARGYYDARVLSVQFDPPEAASSDRVEEGDGEEGPHCERVDDDEGCDVRIRVTVEEGEPVRVTEVRLRGLEGLHASLQEELREAVILNEGDRWDEAFYDESKKTVAEHLREASYACARVRGNVRIDPDGREARIELQVEPGPPALFGELRIEGNEDLPTKPIRGAALIEPGDTYSESAVADAQRAIYNLGAFSAVRVEPQINAQVCPTMVASDAEGAEDAEGEGEAGGDGPKAGPGSDPILVPMVVSVTPGRRQRFGVGAGVQSGTIRRTIEQRDVRQWDVHLLAVYEHRNLFGGLRRLRIEERPRMIFQNIFPRTTDPAPGNLAVVEFRQPAFLEPRTTFVSTLRWDLGPEPFGGRFNRHALDAQFGLERGFLDGRVFLSGGIHGNLFLVTSERIQSEEEGTRDYHLIFFEQYANLDLRDNPRRPHRGAFFSLGLQEAGFMPGRWDGSWEYVRITPEARGYIPLPFEITLAFRFELGAIFIVGADEGLVETAERLGPEQYRLRGGGASSNRGFIPGDLGAGIEGGRRRWESSVELRVPLTESFGLAVFSDFGDVSRGTTFRFNHIHTSVGGGLRYNTPVGPLRLDIGYRVPGLQVVGGAPPDPRFQVDLGFTQFPGAVHLTIGESF